MVHCNILWTCNQTVIIILKILYIKKLMEIIKIANDRRFTGPNWDTLRLRDQNKNKK